MKTSENYRRIDDLGRIVLPMTVRKNLGIENRDLLEIFVNDDKILLKKHEASCVLCGSRKDLTKFKGKHVCCNCRSEIPTGHVIQNKIAL